MLHGSTILSDAIPHGTVDGFRAGCTTGHCPAEVRCAVVHSRYVSDWGFRRRVDAGESPAAIVAAEVAAAARPAPARPAPPVDRPRAALPTPAPPRPAGGPRAIQWTQAELDTITRLNGEGYSDQAIAVYLGRSQSSVNQRRAGMGLPTVSRAQPIRHGSVTGYVRGCRDCPADPSCEVVAKTYWRDRTAARRAGLSITEYRAGRAS